ncbi:hypothetical protein KCP74_18130 [Salmonella enterica subsp. enterica]|nr:hypothetical protein KCP74_18130 [Salmonella enterica subsp. enterica]
MKILPLAPFIIPFGRMRRQYHAAANAYSRGKTSAKLRTPKQAQRVIQSRPPVDAISTYLTGSIYSGDKTDRWKRTITLPS